MIYTVRIVTTFKIIHISQSKRNACKIYFSSSKTSIFRGFAKSILYPILCKVLLTLDSERSTVEKSEYLLNFLVASGSWS